VRTPTSFLSAITESRTAKSALLGIAALGAGGAIVLSGPAAAHAADAPAPAPTAKIASYEGLLQPNGYYCGPAATRVALTGLGHTPSFDELASKLGTTRNGTNSINDVTRVLNEYAAGRYKSVELPATVSPEQTDKMRTDIVGAISAGEPVVANIAGTVTDTAGDSHSFKGGHYIAVTGYADDGRTVTITDSWDKEGSNEYQLPIDTLAGWTATRGYTS
jgi:hypothetical protein